MQYFIVGALLLIIIIGAGWLIGFYNIHTNKKFLLDERRAKLELYYNTESDSESAELELVLIKQAEAYNDQVILYNEFLKAFPNNIAAMILGVKEVSFLEFDEINNRHFL